MTPAWITTAKTIDPLAVAQMLGLETQVRKLPQFQCPACLEVKRGSSDRRLAAEAKGTRWNCWRCNARGDVIDMVAARLQVDQHGVREWFSHRTQLPAAPVRAAPAVEYVPDAMELWQRCTPAAKDDEVSAWLRLRLGVDWLDAADLVRALPARSLPRWARHQGQTWSSSGHRAILPAFDAAGRMMGVRARSVRDTKPKTLPPAGYSAGGLVLADPLGHCLLSGGVLPHGCPYPLPVVVAEGEGRYLARAMRRQWACFGITSGSWSIAVASRIPVGSAVLIDTDHDAAGDKYAAYITDTLRDRAVITRA